MEAGIAREFVALALAEVASNSAPTIGRPRGDRAARLILGSSRRRLRVARVIEATPDQVLAAVGQVLQDSPFSLLLRDTVGGDPRDGGVLVFDLPITDGAIPARGAWGQLRHGAGARQVLATLTPVPSASRAAGGACELVLHADITPGRRGILGAALFLDTTFGMLGGGVGWMVAVKMVVAGASMASWMTGLGAVGLAAGAVGYRAMFRGALAGAERELAHAVAAVAASLRSAVVFGASARLANRPSRTDGHGDLGDEEEPDSDVILPVI